MGLSRRGLMAAPSERAEARCHVGEVTHYRDRPTYDRAVLQWFGEFWLLRDDPLARLDPMKS